MDSSKFDALAKGLASDRTRRSVLKGLVAEARRSWYLKLAAPLDAKRRIQEPSTVCHYDAASGQSSEIQVSQSSIIIHFLNNPKDYLGACRQCVLVDCAYGEWSAWGECTTDCGGGTQTRTRSVIAEAACGGIACQASEQVEEQPCPPLTCPPGFCGLLYDSCGNYYDVCEDKTPTCPVGYCGPIFDACGFYVRDCYNYTVTCAPDACGPLYDECDYEVGTCTGGCAP